MSMYADDISSREFITTSEGYDREEVRAFLEVVARDQEALRSELDALRAERADEGEVGSEIASVLDSARRAAEETTAAAKAEAEALLARVEADADRLRQATIEASDRVREEADLYALQTRADADEHARRAIIETNEKMEKLVSGAEKIRDRLYGIDAVLSGIRAEVAEAASSLDPVDDDAPLSASNPPPPPPPAVIDLRDGAGSNGRVTAEV